MFKNQESFKHLYAKKLLTKWLREIDEDPKTDGGSLGQISWRSNYGVYEELPFYNTSDPYYFELSKGLNWFNDDGSDKLDPRSLKRPYKQSDVFNSTIDRGRILFVPDVTIFHKGCAVHLIEVIHKNPPSEKKMNAIYEFFNGHYFNLWTIPADHILGQIEKPKSLNFELVLEG